MFCRRFLGRVLDCGWRARSPSCFAGDSWEGCWISCAGEALRRPARACHSTGRSAATLCRCTGPDLVCQGPLPRSPSCFAGDSWEGCWISCAGEALRRPARACHSTGRGRATARRPNIVRRAPPARSPPCEIPGKGGGLRARRRDGKWLRWGAWVAVLACQSARTSGSSAWEPVFGRRLALGPGTRVPFFPQAFG